MTGVGGALGGSAGWKGGGKGRGGGGGGGLRAQSNVLVKIEEVDYAMSILMPRVLWMNCFPCSSSIHGRSALVPFY